MNNQPVALKKLLASYRTDRSQEEIFNSIAAHAHEFHEGKITDQEARRLARNFIILCEKMINIQIRLNEENY